MCDFIDILNRKSAGKDYYVRELSVEIICFVFLIFFQNDFTGVSATELGYTRLSIDTPLPFSRANSQISSLFLGPSSLRIESQGISCFFFSFNFS